jgi:hypothetical protein
MTRFYRLLKDTPSLRARAVLAQTPDGRYVPTSDVYLQHDAPQAPPVAFLAYYVEESPAWYERVYQAKPDELRFYTRDEAQKLIEGSEED